VNTAHTIDAALAEFRRHKDYAQRAIAQLTDDHLRQSLSPETNSIAVIVKHLAGNLRSRFTDFLTTDGEKPWRDRDSEFIDDFPDRAAMLDSWERGWACLFDALAPLTEPDLARTVTIRGEPHTVAHALARSLAHADYHTGQIVLIARTLAERDAIAWTTLTIPRGGSRAFNQEMARRTAQRKPPARAQPDPRRERPRTSRPDSP
jgi:uncharacterized damage-inducible protein DinB